VRDTPTYPIDPIQEKLAPAVVLRWVWMGRMAIATAILVAAVFVWGEAAPSDTLIATLAFAVATITTVSSVMLVQFKRRSTTRGFYAAQCAIDLLLVTAVVHVTGGWSSQFAALYILVIASAALLLPFRDGLSVTGAACGLYALDVGLLRSADVPLVGLGIQLVVFIAVSVGSGYVVLRLRQAGAGRELLAAQLVKVQLEAADILRTIRSGIVTVDNQGRLLYANPAASDLLGIDLRAYTGRVVIPSLRGVAPRLADLLERAAKDLVRTNRAEARIRRQGSELEIGVTTTVAEDTGPEGTPAATAIFQDISDSKRITALNVRAERLQAVAELSASLAHEIRNPLAAIRSATEQLARMQVPSGTERDVDQQTLHDLVVRESDRLSRLLADFLDFARARVSQLQPVALGELVRRSALLAAAHPDRQPGVSVDVFVTPDLPEVDGDEDLLHRAVFNLVLNAVQVVGPEGRVRVTVGWHDPEREGSAPTAITGDLLAITVSDDGPGIPAEMRDRLFEPFVSARPGGSGLGLPVVHRAVEAHRGIVLVDALDPGTRFTLVLPASRATIPAIGVAA
jgi:two-component system sensor histidine kinase PilS (NtrC family)